MWLKNFYVLLILFFSSSHFEFLWCTITVRKLFQIWQRIWWSYVNVSSFYLIGHANNNKRFFKLVLHPKKCYSTLLNFVLSYVTFVVDYYTCKIVFYWPFEAHPEILQNWRKNFVFILYITDLCDKLKRRKFGTCTFMIVRYIVRLS